MGDNNEDIQDIHIATELDRNTISNLKNNKFKRVDVHTLEALCSHFNCTPGDLLVLIEEPSDGEIKRKLGRPKKLKE